MQFETDYGDLNTIMKNLDIIKRKQREKGNGMINFEI